MDLTTKHSQLRCWLEEMFGDEAIPQFEINDNTIEFLYSLSKENKEMDRLTKLNIDDVQHKTEEYKMAAIHIRETLEGVGLPVYVLSNAGKSSLKMLADAAAVLDLRDVNKSSYFLAMANFNEEVCHVMELVSKKQNDLNNMITQAELSLQCLGNMSSYYEKLEEHSAVDIPVCEKRKKDTENLKSKSDKYQIQIAEFEREKSFSNKHLQHETLLRLSQELNELKADLKPLQSKFKSYRSLPPDMNLAKVKIEEAKRELAKLETELQTDIDIVSL